ncbi:hypothetical protein [Deinococcus yavapaiensis]|uniref:Uncharacterized protein n=1 Tax=Deinococcus yavapaiensis KR-236 TaxID=694435 RepID=A0A318S4P9_9DEIO|nr:hypothetical protein [Deinococcus yavapaiensis]PYE52048.1 hypothetical protein DES52_11394 [Deinococcus yavapaiensis KR-236]
MSGRFANLKNLHLDDAETPEPLQGTATPPEAVQTTVPPPEPHVSDAPPSEPVAPPEVTTSSAPAKAARPWDAIEAPSEPLKALNGRVPRSVRLAFDRALTDAMDALRVDVTVDLAVEALARLVVDDEETRERWMHKMWELKRQRRS